MFACVNLCTPSVSQRDLVSQTLIHIFFALHIIILLLLFCFRGGGALHTWMSVYQVCAWCPQRPEEGIRSPGTGVKGGCKPPCECWELNLGPLKKQPVVLLTAEHCGAQRTWKKVDVSVRVGPPFFF